MKNIAYMLFFIIPTTFANNLPYALPFAHEATPEMNQRIDSIDSLHRHREHYQIIREKTQTTGSEVLDFHTKPNSYYNAPNAY